MTVKELINRLQSVDENYLVVTEYDDGWDYPDITEVDEELNEFIIR